MSWRFVSFAVWAALVFALIGLAVATARSSQFKLTDFGRVCVRGRWCRAATLVFWMWLGWHFFAR